MADGSAHESEHAFDSVSDPTPVTSPSAEETALSGTQGDLAQPLAPEAVQAQSATPEACPAEPVAPSDPSLGLTEDLRVLGEAIAPPLDEPAAASDAPAALTPEPATDSLVVDEAESGATDAAELVAGDEDKPALSEVSATEELPAEPSPVVAEETVAHALDDIAPGTIAQDHEAIEAATEESLAEKPRTKVSWWPFAVYILAWLGGAGYVVWKLQETPTTLGAYEPALYEQSLRAALALLAFGPALLLIVWLASWIGRKNSRIGAMFISALVRGATATFIGALIWMGALLLLDYLRLGKPY